MKLVKVVSQTDEELENILRKTENPHVVGSRFQQAKIELEIRRNKRLFTIQKNYYEMLEKNLGGITEAVYSISKKPLLAILIAAGISIVVGILIELGKGLVFNILKLQ